MSGSADCRVADYWIGLPDRVQKWTECLMGEMNSREVKRFSGWWRRGSDKEQGNLGERLSFVRDWAFLALMTLLLEASVVGCEGRMPSPGSEPSAQAQQELAEPARQSNQADTVSRSPG